MVENWILKGCPLISVYLSVKPTAGYYLKLGALGQRFVSIFLSCGPYIHDSQVFGVCSMLWWELDRE